METAPERIPDSLTQSPNSPGDPAAREKKQERLGYLLSGAVALGVALVVIARFVGEAPTAGEGAPGPERSGPERSGPERSGPDRSGLEATATVLAGKPRQRLEGIGAATAYYQNWITAHPHKQALYQALFADLDLDILRLQNVYRPEKGARFAEADAEIVRGARQALGHPILLMMSSWSPPAALKSTGKEKNGGTLAKVGGRFNYAGFAAYWRDSLLAYRKLGIYPAYISIQNEPDWKAEWETCLFQPEETSKNGEAFASYGKALDAVHASLQTLPSPPRILGPETLGIGYGNPERYLPPGDTTRLKKVYGIAHHLYSGGTHEKPDSFVPRLQAIRASYPDKPRFQTEFGRSDGFQTAWVIHNSLVEEEATAYVYWAAIWPGEDALITIDNPWEQAKWKYPRGYRLNDRYFALKHYSAFIRPGYRRVETRAEDSELKISAFLSADSGKLTVVALNTSTANPKSLRLNIQGFQGKKAVAFRTCEAAKERFHSLGDFTAAEKILLPPRSLVTVALEGERRQ